MKLKRFLFIALLFYFFISTSTILFSQPPTTTTFRISYNYALFDLPGNTIQAPNKDYILGGTNASFGASGSILRLDTTGMLRWAKIYSPIWGINDVKNITSNENVVTGSVATGGNAGLALMRFTSSGSVVFGKTFKTSALGGNSESGARVIQATDGGFLVAGTTYDNDPDGAGALPRQDSANYFIVKTTSAGTLQWARVVFPTTAYINDHVLYDVAEVSDGYIFVGNMSENGTVGDATTDAVILKTDFNGNFMWMNKYGASGTSQSFNSAVTLGSGEVLICGTNDTRTMYLRINSAGTIASGYRYTPGFLTFLDGGRMFATADGNYSMMGMYISFGSFNSFLFKINPANGTMFWGKRYSAFGGILAEGQQTADGGYIINMMEGNISWDYLVLKTDPVGQIPASGCAAPVNYTLAPSAHGLVAVVVTPTFVSVSNENVLAITPVNIVPTYSVECSYLMPVEITSFEAKSKVNEVKLIWSTASEKNNDYFTIERSNDAKDWNEIGKVKSAGNSSLMHTYDFTDSELPITSDIFYYRLRQTDYDGNYKYFGPISAKPSSPDKWQLILENVSTDILKGKLFAADDEELMIQIMDLQGRIIKREKLFAVKGVNHIHTDLSDVDKGVYFIKIYDSQNLITGKFLKM